MSIKWMSLKTVYLNEKTKKNVSMLMEIFLYFLMGAATSGIFAYALDDETEMMKW
jgi:hypothetical protein